MKKIIIVIHLLCLIFNIEMSICNEKNYKLQDLFIDHKMEQVSSDNTVDEFDKDDEKLFQDMLHIFSSSYKNIIDIAGIYFCGLSVDQNRLYEQIFIQLSKDVFNVVKLFVAYVPVMLKNSKLTIKQKLKKSSYILSATIVSWYLCAEVLSNKFKNNSLALRRSSDFESCNILTDNLDILKPRNRPRMDS
jgi:hypothetical protein